jgi:hypothetical protein
VSPEASAVRFFWRKESTMGSLAEVAAVTRIDGEPASGGSLMRPTLFVTSLATFLLLAATARAAPPSEPAARPEAAPSAAPTPSRAGYVVEAYYRFRWGAEDEFHRLFEKNHLPFLRRMLEKGSLLEVRMERPREHLSEESRWDLRVTLVYRDALAATNLGEIDEADYVAIVGEGEAEARFKEEEQRRFSLLLAHWDVNVQTLETFEP